MELRWSWRLLLPMLLLGAVVQSLTYWFLRHYYSDGTSRGVAIWFMLISFLDLLAQASEQLPHTLWRLRRAVTRRGDVRRISRLLYVDAFRLLALGPLRHFKD
jgi:hypothetical protein